MSKKSKKILVNVLSVMRVIGAALFPYLFKKISIQGSIIFISLLFITDFIDGKLARRWGVCTKGGSMFDPLGDKVLAISCIIVFMGNEYLLLGALILDILIALINILRTIRGEIVNTSIIGKIKTFILSIVIILTIINATIPGFFSAFTNSHLIINNNIIHYASMFALIWEIIAVFDYLYKSFKFKQKEKKKGKYELKSLKEILKILFDEERYMSDREKPISEIIRKTGD